MFTIQPPQSYGNDYTQRGVDTVARQAEKPRRKKHAAREKQHNAFLYGERQNNTRLTTSTDGTAAAAAPSMTHAYDT